MARWTPSAARRRVSIRSVGREPARRRAGRCAAWKSSGVYSTDPVTVSSLRMIRMRVELGPGHAGAGEDEAPPSAELARAPSSWRRPGRSTRSPRRTGASTRSIGSAGSAERVRARPTVAPDRRGQRAAGARGGSLTVMSSTPSARRTATVSRPIGPAAGDERPGRRAAARDRRTPRRATATGSASAAVRRSSAVGERVEPRRPRALVAWRRRPDYGADPGYVAVDAQVGPPRPARLAAAAPAARARRRPGRRRDQPLDAGPGLRRSTPEYSWPCTEPGVPQPSITKWRSLPQIPQWLISTSTSPDAGTGTATERTATFPCPS